MSSIISRALSLSTISPALVAGMRVVAISPAPFGISRSWLTWNHDGMHDGKIMMAFMMRNHGGIYGVIAMGLKDGITEIIIES